MAVMDRTHLRVPVLALLWLSFAFCGDGYADPVSLERASRAASNWLQMLTGADFRPLTPLTESGSTSARRQPTYYIINMQPDGWVIVAGDDRAYPIIGYSTEGEVPRYQRPPAFEAWMLGVSDEIAAAQTQPTAKPATAASESADVAAKIETAWERLDEHDRAGAAEMAASASGVGPLLNTTWSQGQYYNQHCPLDSNGPDGRALVGCVATAMGQIMRHHEHPASGNGSHSYDHGIYGTLSADFGSTSYAWSSMPESGALSSYNSAVATLLYHAGVAVDMGYGPDASGALPSAVAPALREYFRYRTDDLAYRGSYSSAQWLQKLRDEIDAGRPVFYGGYSYDSGHAFVCDGYTSGEDYFHFNWGWGGYADGNYYLDYLTPGGNSFNADQAAVLGIEPGENGAGGALMDVMQQIYAASVYDSLASYYGGFALATGGYATFRYYTYLYAYYTYVYSYNAFYLAPAGSATQSAAYWALLYAYYRYAFALYDYVYGGYGYYVLEYALYHGVHRAQVNVLAAEGQARSAAQDGGIAW
jgi:hypothetical protein